MKRIIILSLFVLLVSNQFLNAKILNDSIPSGKNFEKAAFRLWYPDDLESIKGILVLVPGSNSDGRFLATDTLWQNFSLKHDFAVMACYFKDLDNPDSSFVEQYVNVSQGSGQALLDIINKFSRSSGHNELENAPLLFWGASAGGQFNYEFACWHPDRVIAFVVNKGGIYYTALAPKETRSIPAIFFTGENDLEARNDIIKGLFSLNRRAGALWMFAPEPGVAHEFDKSKELSITFFNEVIPLRLKVDQTGKKTNVLIDIKESDGLLGDHKNNKIIPANELKNNNYPVSWLPGNKTANAWINFISKNK